MATDEPVEVGWDAVAPKTPLTCSTCEKVKPDVKWAMNPYTYELFDEERWEWFCDECYQDAIDDI